MSNFPGGFDDDSTLPAVNDNLTEIGGDAINALRDAVFQIEQTLGLNVQGVTPNLAARLGVFINSDGTPNASVLTSLGLVTLPIRNDQIAENAGIPESKLMLDFRTQDLFNYIRDLSLDVNTALGWINVSGTKLEPHLIGAIYRHTMDQIDVSQNTGAEPFLSNVQHLLRNNLNAYTLANDMNNELLAHQWADGSGGSILGPPFNIVTNNGSIYTSLYAHLSSGIFLDSSRFTVIPQTRDNLQLFAEYIDTESIFLLGTRIQNLYSAGISNVSTSSTLNLDGYGQAVVPPTPAIAFLKNIGNLSVPFDDINSGDDIVQFVPSLVNQASFAFDSAFSLVRPGDIIRVLYGDGYNLEVPYVIREKKYNPGTGPGTANYVVRIAGKNQAYSPDAIARIDRPLANNNKFGELAISPVNNLFSGEPSLIINNPRGAQVLGIGFDAAELDEHHYNLYLALFPTGFVSDGYTFLPPIDVTGNFGTTPGQYTLEGIVQATNNAFRKPGYNYRFTAFVKDGNFGICLADSYNNAGFSIVSAVVNPGGFIDTLTTALKFPNNVLDLTPTTTTITTGAQFTFPQGSITVASTAEFTSSGSLTVTTTTGTTTVNYTSTSLTSFGGVTGGTGTVATGATISQPLAGGISIDPLGIGPLGANVASPPFLPVYGSSAAALQPTRLFIPLRRNNYYVNGVEAERLAIPNTVTRLSTQAEDSFGDGYWVGTVQVVATNIPGRVQTTYRVFQDLSVTNIKAGKTIVVQPVPDGYVGGTILDFGRFTIQSVTFNCAPNVYTDITVWDAVHANGFTPVNTTIKPFGQVAIYFSDDSATFNAENASDFAVATPSGNFKRHFEIYVDDNGSNFTQERGRFTLNSTATPTVVNGVTLYGYGSQLNKVDLVTISPKLRGYQFGTVTKITLNMTSFVSATGTYTGNLASFDGTNFTHVGPTTTGKIGEITRFYDETYTDYIEISFATATALSDFTNQQLDIQLFPSLQLDTEFLLLGTCQVNDSLQQVSKIVDRRQFGNISEKDLSTSVFEFMSVPEKYFHSNGVVRGFDIPAVNGIFSGGSKGIINLAGGVVLVNGKIVRINNETISIPIVKESYQMATWPVNWLLCVNDAGEYVLVPQLDFDANLGTPNAPTRIFTALDFVSSSTYTIPAITFSDLINRRPDLVPLYQVSSTITGVPTTPIITITVQDVRKYNFKKDWGYVPTLNVDANNGDFRSFAALGEWLNLNSTYTNSAILKGTFTSAPSTLTYNNPVIFYGDGTANFTPSNGQFGMLKVELHNFTITASVIELNSAPVYGCTFNYSPAGVGHFTVFTSRMENCTINHTSQGNLQFFAGSILENVTVNMTAANQSLYIGNIAKNCVFNINGSGGTITIDVNAVVENCVFNLTGNTAWSVTGAIVNNIINFSSVSANSPVTFPVPTAGNAFRCLNNKFSLSVGAAPPTSFIAVNDTVNGTIIGNQFFRGSSILTNGYVLAPASYTSGVVAVEDNFFDNSTTDGTNQNLVKNLPLAWMYKNNLNTPSTISTHIGVTGNGLLPYTVTVNDNVILLTPQAAMTVNLPQVSLSPPGRTITIKDISGVFDINPVTLHRALVTEFIENIQADYVFNMAYGSLTLVATANGWTIV